MGPSGSGKSTLMNILGASTFPPPGPTRSRECRFPAFPGGARPAPEPGDRFRLPGLPPAPAIHRPPERGTSAPLRGFGSEERRKRHCGTGRWDSRSGGTTSPTSCRGGRSRRWRSPGRSSTALPPPRRRAHGQPGHEIRRRAHGDPRPAEPGGDDDRARDARPGDRAQGPESRLHHRRPPRGWRNTGRSADELFEYAGGHRIVAGEPSPVGSHHAGRHHRRGRGDLLVSLGEGTKNYVEEQFAGLGSNILIVTPGKIETKGGPPVIGAAKHKLTLSDAHPGEEGTPVRGGCPRGLRHRRGTLRHPVPQRTGPGVTPSFSSVRNLHVEIGASSPIPTGRRSAASASSDGPSSGNCSGTPTRSARSSRSRGDGSGSSGSCSTRG